MNEFHERRFSRRVEVDLPCRVEQGGSSFDCRVLDLSLAGARISTSGAGLNPQAKVTVEFLPGTKRAFSLAAAVVHLQPPDSVSLMFRGDIATIGSRVAPLLRRKAEPKASGGPVDPAA